MPFILNNVKSFMGFTANFRCKINLQNGEAPCYNSILHRESRTIPSCMLHFRLLYL